MDSLVPSTDHVLQLETCPMGKKRSTLMAAAVPQLL